MENPKCWLVSQMSLLGSKLQPTVSRHFALLTSTAKKRLGPNLFLGGHIVILGKFWDRLGSWGQYGDSSGIVTGIVQG